MIVGRVDDGVREGLCALCEPDVLEAQDAGFGEAVAKKAQDRKAKEKLNRCLSTLARDD